MSKDQLHSLIEKYITGQSTPEDINTLRRLLLIPDNVAELKKIMDDQLSSNTHSPNDFPDVVSRIATAIENKIEQQKKATVHHHLRFFKRWSIAASFLTVFALSAIFLIFYRSEEKIPVTV
jgi:hypothetical protein